MFVMFYARHISPSVTAKVSLLYVTFVEMSCLIVELSLCNLKEVFMSGIF